jgi:hypothetical protein
MKALFAVTLGSFYLYRKSTCIRINPVYYKELPEYVKWVNSIKYQDMQCIKYNNKDVPIYKLLEEGTRLVATTCTNYIFFDHVRLYYQYEIKPESNRGGQFYYVENYLYIPKVIDFKPIDFCNTLANTRNRKYTNVYKFPVWKV